MTLLRAREAAVFLSLSEATVRKHLPGITIGRCVRYDVEAYIANRKEEQERAKPWRTRVVMYEKPPAARRRRRKISDPHHVAPDARGMAPLVE